MAPNSKAAIYKTRTMSSLPTSRLAWSRVAFRWFRQLCQCYLFVPSHNPQCPVRHTPPPRMVGRQCSRIKALQTRGHTLFTTGSSLSSRRNQVSAAQPLIARGVRTPPRSHADASHASLPRGQSIGRNTCTVLRINGNIALLKCPCEGREEKVGLH